jgi:hypothetical protein
MNAVDSMQRDRMQWIPCSVAQWSPIECSGFHAAWHNEFRLSALDSMLRGVIDTD